MSSLYSKHSPLQVAWTSSLSCQTRGFHEASNLWLPDKTQPLHNSSINTKRILFPESPYVLLNAALPNLLHIFLPMCVFSFIYSTLNLSSHSFVYFLFRLFLPRSHKNVTFKHCLPKHPTVLPRCCHVQIYSLLLHTHS